MVCLHTSNLTLVYHCTLVCHHISPVHISLFSDRSRKFLSTCSRQTTLHSLDSIGGYNMLNLVQCNSCRRTQASGWCTFWSYSRHHKTWSIWSSYSSCRSLGRIGCCTLLNLVLCNSCRRTEASGCCTFWSYSRHHKT